MENKQISTAVIKRLPRYYRYLGELLINNKTRISSQELSESMGITASQIRQDLSNFGAFGQQGYGYNVEYLYNEIKKIMGIEKNHKLIIIGAGNIGKALANYSYFGKLGFDIAAIFDIEKSVIGLKIRGVPVYNISYITGYLKENCIDIAVIATPGREAVKVAELVASLGVKGIWNFAGTDLHSMENKDVIVENVHLTDSLITLAFKMNLPK